MEQNNIIIYNTEDGKAKVVLYAQDGNIWMNQNQMAELFDTSKQNIGQHIANILSDNELSENSVVNNYFTTASDGKNYNVTFYSPINRWNFMLMKYMKTLIIVEKSMQRSRQIKLKKMNYVSWNQK